MNEFSISDIDSLLNDQDYLLCPYVFLPFDRELFECLNIENVASFSTKRYFVVRFLLPKDIQQLLEDRVKTFNNMAQVPLHVCIKEEILYQ